MPVIRRLPVLWLAMTCGGAATACTTTVSGYAYTWTVRTAAIVSCDLPGTVVVTPAAAVGDPVTATLTVANPAGVTLLLEPPVRTVGAGALWSAVAHPAGAAAVPPGGAVTFTWTGTASTAGPLTVDVRTAGVRDGWPITIAGTGAGRVASRVQLRVAATGPATAPRSGDSFEVRAVVAVSGGAAATILGAVLTCPADAAMEIVRSPADDASPVAAGGHRELVWVVRAGRAGVFPVSVRIAARDGADPLEGTGETPIVVSARFDARCVAFPNPVTGDRLLVGIELTAPAPRVELEAFNAALDRVYRGVWTGVRPGDELAIDGVGRWGSGAYVLRARVLDAAGAWNAYPTVRVEVAR